jgi:hypothetical protein
MADLFIGWDKETSDPELKSLYVSLLEFEQQHSDDLKKVSYAPTKIGQKQFARAVRDRDLLPQTAPPKIVN